MKYIGSKAKYAAEIVPLLQDIIERYDVGSICCDYKERMTEEAEYEE